MVKDIIKDSPSIQEERKPLDQLNAKWHPEWSVMELKTRTSKEQTKINLQNKHLRLKVLKKLKQLHQKNNHDLVLKYFIPRWLRHYRYVWKHRKYNDQNHTYSAKSFSWKL